MGFHGHYQNTLLASIITLQYKLTVISTSSICCFCVVLSTPATSLSEATRFEASTSSSDLAPVAEIGSETPEEVCGVSGAGSSSETGALTDSSCSEAVSMIGSGESKEISGSPAGSTVAISSLGLSSDRSTAVSSIESYSISWYTLASF